MRMYAKINMIYLEMKILLKKFKYIILAYGFFLGWLLSFPFNGPVLKSLASLNDVSIASYSLTYTAIPVIFLIIYSFLQVKEKYAKSMMTWSIIICLLSTILIFSVPTSFWYPIFAIMGIFSVLYIIGWSYFYTMEIPIDQKIRVMALVIIIGNTILYLINILHSQISTSFLLVIMLILLVVSYLATIKIEVKEKINIQLEQKSFPVKLVFVISIFLFIINLNGGLTFHAIYPSFDQLFLKYSTYYSILPYIITLALIFFYGHKISIMLLVFLGTSLLGLAYLSFGLMGENWYNYFITETLMQVGWALLDLVLWSLLGLVASFYGRPLKISGYALLANLLAVFAGGVLGLQILNQYEDYYLISAAFAISVIFISLIIIHWLNEIIDRDLRSKLLKTSFQNKSHGNGILLSTNLPQNELLTPREKEITELLLQGYTNKQIADMVHISENTMKTHSRNIYSKLNIANKRELLHLAFSSSVFQERSKE